MPKETKEVETTIESELTEVKGIGPKTAEKLIEANITTIAQLAVMRPEELKDILDITLKASKDMTNDAKTKALNVALAPQTMKSRMEYMNKVTKRISTGSLALDNLFRGGFPTESIIVLSGEYSSGKTQMCFQLAVNTVKAGRKVAWIETEPRTFVPERLLEIAQANGVTFDPDKDLPLFFESKQVESPYKLFLAYEMIDRYCKENKVDLGLIIIDSFTSKFRTFFGGREQLPDRCREENRHFGYLDYLASKYNCLIILTNQIMDTPDQGGQYHNIVKTGTKKEIYGGNAIKHSGTYLIMLQKKALDEYEAFISDAPDVPFTKISYRVLKSGIKDVSTRGQ